MTSRTINAIYTDIQKDVREFENMLYWACELAHIRGDKATEIVEANRIKFHEILRQKAAPSAKFKELGYGTYKECYLPYGTSAFIIKFVSAANKTATEMQALRNARLKEVNKFFCPTRIMYIESGPLPASLLERTHEDLLLKQWLTAIIIQPRVVVQGDIGYTPLIAWNPTFPTMSLFGDEPTPELKEVSRQMASLTNVGEWWQQAIDEYGFEECARFINFCDAEGLTDLHEYNVGYLIYDGRELPVILDWISAKAY